MQKKQLLSIIALCAACANAAPVFAADSNFYGVFSLGRTKLDADPSAVDAYNLRSGFTRSATSTSTGTGSGKAQLGYNLGKTFALIGVGISHRLTPPSEPYVRFSRIRLSS